MKYTKRRLNGATDHGDKAGLRGAAPLLRAVLRPALAGRGQPWAVESFSDHHLYFISDSLYEIHRVASE